MPSAICSEAGGARAAAARRCGRRPAADRAHRGRSRPTFLLAVLAAVAVAGAGGGPALARVYATQQEALARLFPAPLRVERRTAYLSEEQARRVTALSGEPLEYRVVPYYVAWRGSEPVGYAFTDAHRVRTLPESVLFAVEPDGRIRSTEILSFDEPEDYRPGARWLEQFGERRLDEDLSLKREIRTLAGATLSARAITGAARRVLALFEVIVGVRAEGAR